MTAEIRCRLNSCAPFGTFQADNLGRVFPLVSFYGFSGVAFTSGIETHTVDREKLRIYSAEKSVANAFAATSSA